MNAGRRRNLYGERRSGFAVLATVRSPRPQGRRCRPMKKWNRVDLLRKLNGEVEVYVDDEQLEFPPGSALTMTTPDLDMSRSSDACGRVSPLGPDGSAVVCELQNGHAGKHKVAPKDRPVTISWREGDKVLTFTS